MGASLSAARRMVRQSVQPRRLKPGLQTGPAFAPGFSVACPAAPQPGEGGWPRAARIPRPGLSFRRSWGYLSTKLKDQKTHGGFSGTIFFGGAGSPHVAHNQRLAMAKIPKNRKNAKKSVKYFPRDPRFVRKRPKKHPFFSVKHRMGFRQNPR